MCGVGMSSLENTPRSGQRAFWLPIRAARRAVRRCAAQVQVGGGRCVRWVRLGLCGGEPGGWQAVARATPDVRFRFSLDSVCLVWPTACCWVCVVMVISCRREMRQTCYLRPRICAHATAALFADALAQCKSCCRMSHTDEPLSSTQRRTGAQRDLYKLLSSLTLASSSTNTRPSDVCLGT